MLANSGEPDQMPCSAASDLCLHCLPMSFLCDAKHKWVKIKHAYNITWILMPFKTIFVEWSQYDIWNICKS